MILKDQNGQAQKYTYYDGVLFGHALNFDTGNRSKCQIDLSDTPFEIDEEKQHFNSFGKVTKASIDKETKTN